MTVALRSAVGLSCLALLLTGCSARGTGTAAAKDPLSVWLAQAQPGIDRVEQAITEAQRTARHPDHTGLAAACGAISAAVGSVLAGPPSPDAVMRSDLAHEMADFQVAASQCVATNFDAAGSYVDQGYVWAEQYGKRLHTLIPSAPE